MLTYVCVRARVAVRAEHCKSRSSERLSLCPCAPAPFRRVQAHSIMLYVSRVNVVPPLLPFGTPPPLGIEFIPPKMRDFLFHKGANRAFMKTPLEKGLSLALT